MKKVLILTLFILFSTTLTAQENDTLIDMFDLPLEELMQIELYSATKRTEAVTDIPASIVIISRKEIQANGWQTLEEVLAHIPGMYMVNDYLWFGTDNYGVRGFFSTGSFNTMIVMVNGVTQKEDWYNSFPFTKINVPVEAIDKIEVIRGPMSVIYGNNAFLGAINIVTNQTQQSAANASGGSNGNYNAFMRFSDKKDDLSYTINAGMYGSNGIDAPYAGMMSNPANLLDWNLPEDATSTGQLEDHRKYLGISLKHKSLFFEHSQAFTRRGVVDFYPGYDDGHLAEIQAANTVIGFNQTYGNNTTMNLKLGYYSLRNRLDYKHNTDTTAYGFNDIYSDAFDGEINLNFEPSDKFMASVGAYYRFIFRDKLVVDAPNLSVNYNNLDAGLSRHDSKSNWAVYAQAGYTIKEKIQLIGGIRFSQTPQYDINYMVRFDPGSGNSGYLAREGTYLFDDVLLIPRAAILYHISSIHHLKLMYGMAVREPSIGENMDVVRYPDRPQLKPAYMQTVELNYTGLVSDYASINLSVFQNNVNNLISRTNTIENGTMQLFNTNSGHLQTLGTELSVMLKGQSKFSSRISVTYQYSENMQDGYEDIDLEYAPPLLGYISASYNFYKEHTIAFSAYYVDKMETYWNPSSTSIDPNDGSRIGEASPAYFVGNLNLRFNNLLGKGVYCYAHLHNIFDTDVVYPTTRSNDEFDLGTAGYGRYFSVGLGIATN